MFFFNQKTAYEIRISDLSSDVCSSDLDANDYSEMLGYTTVRKQNLTRRRDFSRNESEERRALMLPQELNAMGFDKEVFLYEGIPHPVMCEKIKYYQDRYFTKRLLPKVDVSQVKF